MTPKPLTLPELKPILKPLFAGLLLAAEVISNDAPATVCTEANRDRLIEGALDMTDRLWAELERREAAEKEAHS